MDRNFYKRLGDYILPTMEKNVGLKVRLSQGINNNKYFQTPRQVAQDSENDQIVRRGQFAFNKATTRNGDKISIAYRDGEDCTVSSAYQVFYIKDEEQLNPYYLMMWFKRPEFDRYARFKSHGSAHEFFTFEEMCNILLPVPSIEEQRRIVSEYQTLERLIKNNEAMIQKLEDTAQALYHHTFVESIDENNLPEGWRKGCLGDIAEYVKDKISTNNIEDNQYISTEDIEKDKKGINKSSSTPEDVNVTEFKKGDILISNIRPYFKKIWLASFDGGCSTDVLCYRAQENEFHKFLYYTLFDNKFFDYVVAGCKGTKMPRGDKEWNMKYPILVPSKKSLDDYSLKVKPLLDYSSSIVAETSHLRSLLSLLTSKLS